MYCSQCGAKLPDTAQFCSQCGEPVVAPAADDAVEKEAATPVTEVVGGDSSREAVSEIDDDSVASPLADKNLDSNKPVSEDYSDGERQSFTQRMIAFRRTTLKAVPTFVLAIFAFLAAAGTAYAAFKVVTEVVIPAIEQVINNESVEGDATQAAANAPNKPEDDAAANSIVRVCELLTGDGEKTARRLDRLGFEPGAIEEGPFGMAIPVPIFGSANGSRSVAEGAMRWASSDYDSIGYAALNESGLLDRSLESLSGEPGRVYFGSNWTSSSGEEAMACNSENITLDGAFDSVALIDLPIVELDEESLVVFKNLVGIAGDIYTYRSEDERGGSEAASCAAQTVGGVDYLVYFYQGTIPYEGGRTFSNLYAIPLAEGVNLVVKCGLYSEEEYLAASRELQLSMVAQSIVQERLTGNGGQRVNLRTGEIEEWWWDDTTESTGFWLSLEEYNEKTGSSMESWLDAKAYSIQDLLG